MKIMRLLSLLFPGAISLTAMGSESELVPDITLNQVEENPVDQMSLEEIDQKLNNPLTSLWSLTFQENYSIFSGDKVKGTTDSNTFPFKLRFEPQYSLIKPDDIGARWNFRIQITPVIPSPFKK